MPATTWKRLTAREGKTEVDDTLVEGVPEWLLQPLWDWVSAFVDPLGAHYLDEGEARSRLIALQTSLRLRLDFAMSTAEAAVDLGNRCQRSPDLFLDVVDYLLATHANHSGAAALEALLRAGGSAWTIGVQEGPTPDGRATRHLGLVRRVDPSVAEATKHTISSTPRAGAHLAAAWAAAYGRKPEATTAYREAVRAVEVAVLPVVSPKNLKGTLGSAIKDMENGGLSGKYTMVLQPGTAFVPMDAVIGMCRLLWTAQLDRHGTADVNVPMSVSIVQARAAVHLAVTLVQWFSSGAIVNQKP